VKQLPTSLRSDIEDGQKKKVVLKRSIEVLQSDTVKTDTAKTKNNLQIQKPFSPDSAQRNAVRLEKDTVKQLPISP
jgi:hypothetical protein